MKIHVSFSVLWHQQELYIKHLRKLIQILIVCKCEIFNNPQVKDKHRIYMA
jgi:hypothetical protein